MERRWTYQTSAVPAPASQGLLCAGWVFVLVLLFLALGLPARAASPFVETASRVRPAVVNIRCIRSVTDQGVGTGPLQEMYRRFFPDQEGKGGRFEMPSTGSGFVVDPAGYILTNDHVIAEAEAVFVRFTGEHREYPAEVVGADPGTDLAVLKIDPAGRDLPVLEFGDSDTFAVGDWAIAVGNPFGNLESTLTVGVVSAKGRGDLVIGGQTPRYQDFIQTDASINFGNSGGPLVDVAGRVMGVNTAINKEGRGIGFAVPSNLARQVYRQLRDNGEVVRGYLGIRTEDVVPVVGGDVEEQPGARILAVIPGEPAETAGLRAGDVVTAFDGHRVRSRRDLQFRIASAEPGQTVPVTVIRDGRTLEMTVTPSRWSLEGGAAAAPEATGWLGLEVAAVESGDPRVAMLKETLGISLTRGVMVVAVHEGSEADEAGIRPGDIIVAVNGRDIPDVPAWENVRDLLRHRTDPVTILVRTGTVENYVSVLPRPQGVEN